MEHLRITKGPGVEIKLKDYDNVVYFYFGGDHMEKVSGWCTGVEKESVGEMIKWLTEWYIEHDTP